MELTGIMSLPVQYVNQACFLAAAATNDSMCCNSTGLIHLRCKNKPSSVGQATVPDNWLTSHRSGGGRWSRTVLSSEWLSSSGGFEANKYRARFFRYVESKYLKRRFARDKFDMLCDASGWAGCCCEGMRNLGRVRRGRSWSIDFSAANATFAHVPLAVLVKDTIRRETNADGDEHEQESNDRFKVHGSGTKQDEDEENVLALHFCRFF